MQWPRRSGKPLSSAEPAYRPDPVRRPAYSCASTRLPKRPRIPICTFRRRASDYWQYFNAAPRNGGRLGLAQVEVKAVDPQAPATPEPHGGDPPAIVQPMQLPEVQDPTWRDAEIDEIRAAVEFRPEFRLPLDHARDAAVGPIEHV